MNTAHLHLMLNHFPIVGTVIGLALLGYALLRRNPELIRVALGTWVLLALVGLGVFLTGEPAEELVEGVAGVTEAVIEPHEEAALVATTLLAMTGAVALGSLVWLRANATHSAVTAGRLALVLALAPTGAMAYTAYLGGRIRHTEVRPDAVAPLPAPAAAELDEVTLKR